MQNLTVSLYRRIKTKIVFVKAKKHLGQHFLTDESIAKKIAASLSGNGYDDVLEIGPGMGVLTKYLLPQKAKITVLELDRESVAYLHDTFPLEHIKLDTSAAHFSVLEGDFLKKISKTSLIKNKSLLLVIFLIISLLRLFLKP